MTDGQIRNVTYIIDFFLNFSVEKDHHDNTAKTRESQDCSQKVLELQKRLDQARAEVTINFCHFCGKHCKFQIRLLPGIEYSKEQQLHHLEALKTQLKLKQELLRKYRYMYTFEVSKS